MADLERSRLTRRQALQVGALGGAAALLDAACSSNSSSASNPELAYPLPPSPDGTVIFDPELQRAPDRGLANVRFSYETRYAGDPTGRSIAMVPVFDRTAPPEGLHVITEERSPNPAYLVDKEFPVSQGIMYGSDGHPRSTLYPVIGLGLQPPDQEVVYVGMRQNGSSSYKEMRAYLLTPNVTDGQVNGLHGWRLRENRTFSTPPSITVRPK